MPQALAGIRILDLTRGPAGGMATMVLADFGAEVLLIEPWTSLETKFGESEEGSKARAVVKLLNDVYGRAYSTPERRRPMRIQALQSLSERLNDLEGRIKN